MPKRRFFRAILAALVIAAPAAAHAQSSDAKAGAEALFEDGRRLMGEGKYAEACRKLESSQRLDPGAGTLLNLAACYEKNGQTASAWVTYKDAASASADRHRDWADQAREKAAAIEPTLSRLTIVLGVDTPGLEVTRDGVAVASGIFGTALPTDPGPHTIEAKAAGHSSFKTVVTIGPSKDAQTVTIPALAADTTAAPPAPAIAPIAPPAAPPRAPRGSSDTGSTQRIAGATLGAVGVVGLVVGGVFGAIAMGKRSDAKDPSLCTSDLSRCNAAGLAMVNDARSAATISTVGFVAGGVLAAGGLVLFVTARNGAAPSEAAVPRVESLRASAGPAGAPLGLSLGGTF